MATQRQKIAVQKIVENQGNVSKAMREAGYDADTAKNPKNLTDSKGFKELMQQMGVTDDKLVNVINEGLEANKPNEYTGEVLPDHQARHKYLETALRLKGMGKVGSTLSLQTDGGDIKVMVINYAESDSPTV